MKPVFICYLLMFSSLPFLSAGQMLKFIDDAPEAIRDPANVTADWQYMENLLKSTANLAMKRLLPLVLEQKLNISSSCIRDATQIMTGIRKLETWAVRFLDSSAKDIHGTILGSSSFYGSYDECVDTVAVNKHSGKHKGKVMFTGKYCILRFKPYLPPKKPHYKFGVIVDELKEIYERDTMFKQLVEVVPVLYAHSARLGFCIPSGCSVDDVNEVLSKVSDYTGLYMRARRCEVKEDPKYTPLMIFVMTLYSFAGFMVLLGTLTDVYCFYSKKKPSSTSIRVLLAFSLMSNFRKLVTSSSSKSLRCLNGIRFLSMTQVIYGHFAALTLLFNSSSGMLEAEQSVQHNFAYQVIANGVLMVQTFFFLGGFLVAYNATKSVVISKRKLNVKQFIFHRIWRLLPMYTFVILYVFIAELACSGPVAHETIKPYVEDCKENWWANLLFINNFYHAENACVPITWYLSTDMQLYIGSLIILLPLFRYPKVGVSLAAILVVGSMVANGVVTYVKEYPPTFIKTLHMEDLSAYKADYHYKPYTHASSYIIGIIAGYFLALNPDLKIPKVMQLLGWICAIVMSASAMYGTYGWNSGRNPALLETVLYASCHKVSWVLGVTWMIICCETGHGGVVNYILSWTAWIPLARLTYAAYLVHYLVEVSYLASLRSQISPRHTDLVWLYFGHLMASYGVAFAVSMLVESPSMSLEKILLNQREEKMPNKTENGAKHEADMVEVVKVEDNNFLNDNFNVMEPRTGIENAGFIISKL